MSDKPTRIIIPRAGISTGESRPRAVYDHRSSKMMGALGEVVTQRASNVESGSTLSQQALAILSKSGYAVRKGMFWWKSYQIIPEYTNHWFADMTLSGSSTILGPYPPEERETALRDEVAWLNANNIPTCYDCGHRQLFGSSPTGRTSSATPNESNRSKPNFQPATRELWQPGQEHVLVDVDYSGVERRVLEHARREVGEKLFAELQSDIEAVNGWEEDGDTLRRTYFTAGAHGQPSNKRVIVIVFLPASVTVGRVDIDRT